jgi:hypothetical protein
VHIVDVGNATATALTNAMQLRYQDRLIAHQLRAKSRPKNLMNPLRLRVECERQSTGFGYYSIQENTAPRIVVMNCLTVMNFSENIDQSHLQKSNGGQFQYRSVISRKQTYLPVREQSSLASTVRVVGHYLYEGVPLDQALCAITQDPNN